MSTQYPPLHVERIPDDKYDDLFTYTIVGKFIMPDGTPDGNCVYAQTDNDPDFARLCAAAPDLLAALTALELIISDDCDDYPDMGAYRQVMSACADARAAIRKATS